MNVEEAAYFIRIVRQKRSVYLSLTSDLQIRPLGIFVRLYRTLNSQNFVTSQILRLSIKDDAEGLAQNELHTLR